MKQQLFIDILVADGYDNSTHQNRFTKNEKTIWIDDKYSFCYSPLFKMEYQTEDANEAIEFYETKFR